MQQKSLFRSIVLDRRNKHLRRSTDLKQPPPLRCHSRQQERPNILRRKLHPRSIVPAVPPKSIGRILSREPALPPSESFEDLASAPGQSPRPFRLPVTRASPPVHPPSVPQISRAPSSAASPVSRSCPVSDPLLGRPIQQSSPSSPPLILLSSLEDLSSVEKNHATNSRSCNTKISVQNSSFLCLTRLRILHNFRSNSSLFSTL